MPDIDKHWINSDYYHYYCMNSSTQEQNKIKHRDIQFQDDNRKLYSYSFISNRSISCVENWDKAVTGNQTHKGSSLTSCFSSFWKSLKLSDLSYFNIFIQNLSHSLFLSWTFYIFFILQWEKIKLSDMR